MKTKTVTSKILRGTKIRNLNFKFGMWNSEQRESGKIICLLTRGVSDVLHDVDFVEYASKKLYSCFDALFINISLRKFYFLPHHFSIPK